MEKELENLAEIGKRLGLNGEQLLDYVREKQRHERKLEKDRLSREERAKERDAKREEKELTCRLYSVSTMQREERKNLVWTCK